MTTTPQALALADALDEKPDSDGHSRQAAAMLRAQHEALRRADHLDAVDEHVLKSGTLKPCAAMLRTQHAAIERKDALLKQALEMLGCTHEDDDPGHRCGYCDDYVDRNGTLRAAITKELQ